MSTTVKYKGNTIGTADNSTLKLTTSGTWMEDDVTITDTRSEIPYTGAYSFTPTQSTQTIPINGKTATADITINPIPSNYGLITWDGSTLMVS